MIHSTDSCALEDRSTRETSFDGAASAAGVLVNAAFLEEIKEDNVRLKQILRAIARVLEEDWPANGLVAQFLLLVTALRDQVGVHFDLEETYGYLDHVVETAPELSGLAESARAEHRILRTQINHIVQQANDLLGNDSLEMVHLRLAPYLRDFRRRLERHENAENELIMRAYAEDVGVGD